jgi:putative transcriptional regulator
MTSQLDTTRRDHDRPPRLAHRQGAGRLGTGRLGTGQPARMKNQVRALRMAKDMAQGQLAEAMGVSRQTINSIENERYTPSLPLAMALARYFGVTVEEMFDDQS